MSAVPGPPPGGDPRRQVGRWTWHRATARTTWDDAALALFGARPGETPEQVWARVVHPADVRRLVHDARRRLEDAVVFRTRDEDGGARYLLSSVTGRPDDDSGEGEECWVTGVVLDITACHRADLRAAVALEGMSDGFLALDDAFRVTYLNHSAEVLLERSWAQFVGQVPWEHFPHLADALEGPYRRAARTGEVVTFELPGAAEDTWITSDVHPATEGLHVYLRDTTERHRAAAAQARLLAELEHQATHDALTQLASAGLLVHRAREHLAGGGAGAALVCLDVDRFTLINDALGRARGDELLVEVAARLALVAPPGSLVARQTGDEFLLLLPSASAAQTEEATRAALAALRRPVRLGSEELHLTASAGMACTTAGSAGATTAGAAHDAVQVLLRDAGTALHAAKRAGRDRAVWCDAAMRDTATRRAATERDLRSALREPDQLALHYQPAFSLATGLPVGVEALLRWTHPERGPVPPGEVIPVAEDSGLILGLGEWVAATAAAQAAAWRSLPGFTTWFNVAPRQLASGDVPGALARALARTGLPADRLGIEVTESVLADGSPAGAALAAVRALGVKVAIDDFGTGYSSLSRLLAFPVDLLKIDRSFVVASSTPEGAAVLASIVALGHGLGARVVAEGVETHEQLAALRATACDEVSGYLLGRPAPAADLPLRRVGFSSPVPRGAAPAPRTGDGRDRTTART